MNQGLLKSILYYVIGLALAGISYLIVGPSYHSPGLHHLIVFLTFLGGFFWLITTARKYFLGMRSQNLKWIMVVNLSMCLSFTFLLIFLFNYTPDDDFEEDSDQVIIEESGDTTRIYNRGSVVYYKVKDSVLINFIDSSKVDLSKTERKKK